MALVVEIYLQLRPRSEVPAQTLRSVIPVLAEDEAFLAFESRLKSETTSVGQRKLIREALKDVIGVKPGQWFRKLDANSSAVLVMSVPEKLYIRKQQQQQQTDGSGGQTQGPPGGEDFGLLDLFAK